MQTHYYVPSLPFGLQTSARWAVKLADTVFVFVHGFRGRAVETWLQFPTLLVEQKKCQTADLIFYGYDGARKRAVNSATGFYKLLDQLGHNPAILVNSTLAPSVSQRDPAFSYNRIVIAAHSLGAIVARFALLFAHQEKKPWAKNVRLVLFAPAHKGSQIATMCSSLLGMIKPLTAGGVDAILKLAYPALRDLDVGSTTLKELEDRTRAALPNGAKEHYLIAHRVILGEYDNIVEPTQFAFDPPPKEFAGKNHMQVCKPHRGFAEPVKTLLEAL
jgi:hypothetical protein